MTRRVMWSLSSVMICVSCATDAPCTSIWSIDAMDVLSQADQCRDIRRMRDGAGELHQSHALQREQVAFGHHAAGAARPRPRIHARIPARHERAASCARRLRRQATADAVS